MKFDEHLFKTFVADMKSRLKVGDKEFPDRLQSNDISDVHSLLKDVREELLDVSNYSFLLSQKLEMLEARLINTSIVKKKEDLPVHSEGALFLKHIKAHLKNGEYVVCTICGKSSHEIRKEELEEINRKEKLKK